MSTTSIDHQAGATGSKILISIGFTVPSECHGWRIDHFVKYRIPRLSRSRIQKMLRQQASLGGLKLRVASRVRAGQRFTLLRPAPAEPRIEASYRLLFRADLFVAVDKPAGLVVHSTPRSWRNSLLGFLNEELGPPFFQLAYRLDRETSGVILACRNSILEARVKKELALRRVRKRYLAIVKAGQISGSGVIDAPIGPDVDSRLRIKMTVRRDGRPARTDYRVLDRKGNHYLVELRPTTGRQHQLRVHMAYVGAPIVGDKIYSRRGNEMIEYFRTGREDILPSDLELDRQALHAAAIEFERPPREDMRRFEAPFPEDLRAYWRSI